MPAWPQHRVGGAPRGSCGDGAPQMQPAGHRHCLWQPDSNEPSVLPPFWRAARACHTASAIERGPNISCPLLNAPHHPPLGIALSCLDPSPLAAHALQGRLAQKSASSSTSRTSSVSFCLTERRDTRRCDLVSSRASTPCCPPARLFTRTLPSRRFLLRDAGWGPAAWGKVACRRLHCRRGSSARGRRLALAANLRSHGA